MPNDFMSKLFPDGPTGMEDSFPWERASGGEGGTYPVGGPGSIPEGEPAPVPEGQNWIKMLSDMVSEEPTYQKPKLKWNEILAATIQPKLMQHILQRSYEPYQREMMMRRERMANVRTLAGAQGREPRTGYSSFGAESGLFETGTGKVVREPQPGADVSKPSETFKTYESGYWDMSGIPSGGRPKWEQNKQRPLSTSIATLALKVGQNPFPDPTHPQHLLGKAVAEKAAQLRAEVQDDKLQWVILNAYADAFQNAMPTDPWAMAAAEAEAKKTGKDPMAQAKATAEQVSGAIKAEADRMFPKVAAPVTGAPQGGAGKPTMRERYAQIKAANPAMSDDDVFAQLKSEGYTATR